MSSLVHITDLDNVAVAIHAISRGEEIEMDDARIIALEDIPQGHKIAIRDIQNGTDIIKYGFSIGHTIKNVPQGAWVHSHNMQTNLSGESEYIYEPAVKMPESVPAETFMGYKRLDGTVGIRNEIWIIPTVGCVNDVAKILATDNQNLVKGSIEGLYAYPHPFGCSQTGADHAQTRKLLAALTKHPNAAAVLVVGLGCENLTHEQFLKELGDYDTERVKFLICQDVEDEFEAGSKLLAECAVFASKFQREEVSVSKLVIGMKCGASDGLSGITANPTVGRFSDFLVARGGSTVLTEVPEMFGAEGMLMNRCINQEVFEKAVNMINGFKEYFLNHNEVVYENPSPGNRQGGITTLEDKSCGCVQKGGTAPIADVIGYGDQVITQGLNMMYGPGNDLVSSTALTAAGAHMVLFTTGRGTPFGSPAPTLKISSNTQLAKNKPSWIDFDAGTVVEGETLDSAADRLLKLIIQIASGEKTRNEERGFREISIFKDGVVL